MKASVLIKELKANGWVEVRTSGSHRIFKKEGEKLNIAVPDHGKKDIPPGTLNAIKKAAGIK